VPAWKIAAMLANIPTEEYEVVAGAFERHHRAAGTVSDDWPGQWKAWCRKELIDRGARERQAGRMSVVAVPRSPVELPDLEGAFD
jgi:hypothetical protein